MPHWRYFAMYDLAHSPEQKIMELLREDIVTASREETKAPQVAHLTISAFAALRPPISSRTSLRSFIVSRRRWLNRAIAFMT
jgi:hypothetical protein